MSAPFDPAAVRCPVCDSPPGVPCTEVVKHHRDPHPARAKWAEAERAVEETRAWAAEARQRVRQAVREWRAAERVLALALTRAKRFRTGPAT